LLHKDAKASHEKLEPFLHIDVCELHRCCRIGVLLNCNSPICVQRLSVGLNRVDDHISVFSHGVIQLSGDEVDLLQHLHLSAHDLECVEETMPNSLVDTCMHTVEED